MSEPAKPELRSAISFVWDAQVTLHNAATATTQSDLEKFLTETELLIALARARLRVQILSAKTKPPVA